MKKTHCNQCGKTREVAIGWIQIAPNSIAFIAGNFDRVNMNAEEYDFCSIKCITDWLNTFANVAKIINKK